ncbi:MAG: hypothetical protein ACOC95_00670 [Planctomycetota bacterium]
MAPRKKPSSLLGGVTLFPFLSVLFGVIGSLILVMAAQAALSLADADQYIQSIPGGQTERDPVYVECRADGLLIHPERTAIPLTDLKAAVDRQRDVSDPAWDRRKKLVKRTHSEAAEKAEKERCDRLYQDMIARGLDGDDHPWCRHLVRMIRRRDRMYTVLLVRPDGIKSFRYAQALLQDARLDYGYDPVYAGGEIRIRDKTPRPDAAGQ